MPMRTGKLTLPPVRYSHEGRDYQTQALTVEVVKGSLSPRPAPPAEPAVAFRRRFFLLAFQDRQPQKVDAYLRAVLSKTACFKGEQLLFRVLLYTRNRIEAVNMISSASFAGFWQEWFPVPQSIAPSSENVNGVIYQVYEIRKAALFASESGTLTIPPLQFELQLADPASVFFGAQALRRSTQAVKVTVSEPPGRGRRTAGRAIQLFAALPAARADINEIVTLHMQISGSGNSKAIIPPPLPSDEAVLVYPAKITQETAYAPARPDRHPARRDPGLLQQSRHRHFPVPGVPLFRPGAPQPGQPAQPARPVAGQRRKAALGHPDPAAAPSCRKARTSTSSRAAPLRDRPAHLPPTLVPAADRLPSSPSTCWSCSRSRLGPPHRRQPAAAQPAASWPGPCAGWTGAARRGDRPGHGKLLRKRAAWARPRSATEDRRALAPAPGPGASIEKFLFIKGQSELARFSPHKKSGLELKKDLQALRDLLQEIDRKMK